MAKIPGPTGSSPVEPVAQAGNNPGSSPATWKDALAAPQPAGPFPADDNSQTDCLSDAVKYLGK